MSVKKKEIPTQNSSISNKQNDTSENEFLEEFLSVLGGGRHFLNNFLPIFSPKFVVKCVAKKKSLKIG